VGQAARAQLREREAASCSTSTFSPQPRNLSGGHANGARWVARSFRPRIYLMDEPLSNLDAVARADAHQSVRRQGGVQ